MNSPESYVGKWRIVKMDQWDQEYIDLVVPGHVTIGKSGEGTFQFGALEANLVFSRQSDNPARVEFTWDGFDEGDPVSGQGWTSVDGKCMTGHLCFHFGDDSAFNAIKIK